MTECRVAKSFNIDDNRVAVFFYKEYAEDWGYMNMRDYRTWEPTGEYHIAVVTRLNSDTVYSCDAGYTRRSFQSKSFNKDIANTIYWNLKQGRGYDALRKYLHDNDLIAREA